MTSLPEHTIFPGSDHADPVLSVDLRNGAMEARVITWGAVLNDLRVTVQGSPRSVVLGFDRLQHYRDHGRNQGGNVGRYGGRIRDGFVPIDGESVQLSRNLNNRHHMHGGAQGLGRRNWRIVARDAASVTLEITSPDGDEGYPGTLTTRCHYELGTNGIAITLTAETTAPTPVNFLHHSYFNLDASESIAGHSLQILASEVLEFDEERLATGRFLPLEGTCHDYREPRCLGPDVREDTSFVLPGGLQTEPRLAARLTDSTGRLTMEVLTTEPGMHFYSGFVAAAPVPLQDGRACLAEAGLCLEATRFNDAVTFPAFGDVITRPGKPYRQRTEFRFSET
ncbi:aldose epimerase family protein [Salipiger sp. PrR007]|uniref:aldose epimerase family protein n=1 Tax=Salipiger sp. PrR007 TaxID=2706884 RepID=UPI0013BCF0E7|nr:galactose mutarotase [Salipiger sp. PrR007]